MIILKLPYNLSVGQQHLCFLDCHISKTRGKFHCFPQRPPLGQVFDLKRQVLVGKVRKDWWQRETWNGPKHSTLRNSYCTLYNTYCTLYTTYCTLMCLLKCLLKCHWSAVEVAFEVPFEVPLKCHWSAVEVQRANSHSHRPSPANSPNIHSRLAGPKPGVLTISGNKASTFFNTVSSKANIGNMFFNQKSPLHPEVGVSQWRRQTNKQKDMATLWLNQPRGPIQWKIIFNGSLKYQLPCHDTCGTNF